MGEGIRAAAWRLLREVAAALCLQQEGESPGPTVGPKAGRRSGPAAERPELWRLRRRRCASPAPACAACASAAARALRSSSARGLSQRFAPLSAHWSAARAASQWSRSGAASRAAPGLPAEPQPPAECGRRLLGAPRPAGQRGPGGAPGAKVGGVGGAGRGKGAHSSRWGRQGRCSYLAVLTWESRSGQVALSPAERRLRGSHAQGMGRAPSPRGTPPGCWGHPGREEGAAAPMRCLPCPRD